jgi:uncharacterized protein
MAIFSSHRALEVLAALEQRPDGLRLSELARAIDGPISSTQVAVHVLIEDGLVSADNGPPPSYRLASDQGDDIAKILEVASRRDPGGTLLASALRASPAVEFASRDFASRDHEALMVVTRWDAEPSGEVVLDRMLARHSLDVTLIGHDELRERLHEDDSLRHRAIDGTVIRGSVDRSFPDPFRHGAVDAVPLGQLHPAINPPSRRALSRIARRFRLAEIRVFGSAVHADFRGDSDIDIAVLRQRGVHRSLDDESSLRRELEDLFAREVDLVDTSLLRGPIRERAQSEGVVLYG